MGAALVVVLPVLLAEDFRFQHRGEALPVEELVPEPAVEAFAVGILPRTAGGDVEDLKPAPLVALSNSAL